MGTMTIKKSWRLSSVDFEGGERGLARCTYHAVFLYSFALGGGKGGGGQEGDEN